MRKTNPTTNVAESWFKRHAPAPFTVNRRKSIRYVRNDIGVSIRKSGLLDFNFITNHDFAVKLADISSRGVLIATNNKLPVNKKVLLKIRFNDLVEFATSGKVVRAAEGPLWICGIQFDETHNDLADKLLATQQRLKFR